MTAPVSAHDVARVVRERLPGRVGDKQLEKLLYYCQGWHLAWTNTPLFYEPIEAWEMGPVVPAVWAAEKHRPHDPSPPPLSLSAEQLSIVDSVLDRYGHMTGAQLEHLSHQEGPWKNADRNEVISHNTLRSFFTEHRDMKKRQVRAAAIRERADRHRLGSKPIDAATLAAIDQAVRGETVIER